MLDVGCAKGYMVYDFTNAKIDAYGVDISNYALRCAPSVIRNKLYHMNAKDLELFDNNEFDLVISINTIHNLINYECRQSIREIQRVGKKAFITMDAYKTNEDKKRMDAWNMTAKTILSTDNWIKMFEDEDYNGDYYWFIP